MQERHALDKSDVLPAQSCTTGTYKEVVLETLKQSCWPGPRIYVSKYGLYFEKSERKEWFFAEINPEGKVHLGIIILETVHWLLLKPIGQNALSNWKEDIDICWVEVEEESR